MMDSGLTCIKLSWISAVVGFREDSFSVLHTPVWMLHVGSTSCIHLDEGGILECQSGELIQPTYTHNGVML